MTAQLPYDRTDRDSIVAYAERLVDHSLREVLDSLPPEIDLSGNKGGIGTTLERFYFKYKPNSRPEPDFAEAGVELKATPLKYSGQRLVAKERLVLGMIDYSAIVSEEWESSSFLSKNAHLLLVFYLHEQGKDPRDFVFKIVRLWDFPAEDLEVIRDDWQKIVDKVRAGKAHELSEGDTMYLAACTKASTSANRRAQPYSSELAKPRALSLKASYMNSIIGGSLRLRSAVTVDELRTGKTFEQLVQERFLPYVGLTAEEIARRLEVKIKPRAKNFHAALTKCILGIAEEQEIAEFTKADLITRTIRLRRNGVPKEAVSFPAFDYRDLVEQEWEDSDLRDYLSRRFFFVIYQLNRGGSARLLRTQFWTMPVEHVETYARDCFDKTVECVMEDKFEYLPKSTDNPACHVRPHGRDSHDLLPTPRGGMQVRRSFWLNQAYMAKQLAE